MYNYNDYLLNNYFRKTTPNMRENQPTLYNPTEAYNRGNLFSNLYDSYKNYQPTELNASNEQDALYLEYARMAFAAHELNLYLDLNPDDTTMLALFNDYRSKANELMTKYEQEYGPLTVASDNSASTFLWEKQPWPWKGENI